MLNNIDNIAADKIDHFEIQRERWSSPVFPQMLVCTQVNQNHLVSVTKIQIPGALLGLLQQSLQGRILGICILKFLN